MKKILVSAGVAAMALSMAGTAFASTSTGSHSPVSTKVVQVTTLEVSNTNSSTVDNSSSVIVGTGKNSITSSNGDVNGASILSGDGTATSNVTNVVNMITSTVAAPATTKSEAVTSPSDSSTGSNSKVSSTVIQKDQAAVVNANVGGVSNALSSGTFTGLNKIGTHNGDLNTVAVQSGKGMGTVGIANTVGGVTSMITR